MTASKGTRGVALGGGQAVGGGKMLPFVSRSGGAVVPEPLHPTLHHAVTAMLPVLPDPIRLIHGPLLVTVETWSDGTVVARLPIAALYGAGETDTAALEDLASEIEEFALSTLEVLSEPGAQLGGPLADQWRALTALVDISGLKK